MADIVEYIDLGATVIGDAQIELRLDDDAVTPGTWATTAGTPTRFRLELTNQATGAAVTLDTVTPPGTYTFSAVGGAAHFSWSAGVLTIDLGGLAITTIPAGRYDARLWWYDVANTNGIRWGHQQVVIISE